MRNVFRDKFIYLLVAHFLVAHMRHVPSKSVERITGGSLIDIRKCPYALSYRIQGKHACGASIVNEYWGLTAAHCTVVVEKNPYLALSVRSGSDRHKEGGVIHKVTTLIPHEKFNPENNDYDIAVFKVDPPFHFDSVTQPVKLPDDSASTETEWGVIVGWGYTSDTDPVLSERLDHVKVPKINKGECRSDYAGMYEVTERQVCYGFEEGGKDAWRLGWTTGQQGRNPNWHNFLGG